MSGRESDDQADSTTSAPTSLRPNVQEEDRQPWGDVPDFNSEEFQKHVSRESRIFQSDAIKVSAFKCWSC